MPVSSPWHGRVAIVIYGYIKLVQVNIASRASRDERKEFGILIYLFLDGKVLVYNYFGIFFSLRSAYYAAGIFMQFCYF